MQAIVRPNTGRSFLLTLIAVLFVAAFLSPLLRAATSSIKSTEQLGQSGSPLLPSDIASFDHEGEQVELFNVPLDGTVRQMGLLERGRTQSEFIDPANPTAAPVVWQGSRRTLEPVWTLAPHWENYGRV
jgi:multiple sugar transport system permease protein